MNEALKLALKALEAAEIDGNCEYGVTEIIREALAQPEQEPVAYCYVQKGTSVDILTFDDAPDDAVDGTIFPLYTTPPKREWVGLTENEIEAIEEKSATKQWAIRMALTAVKEKNT
jgi:hypothetical protein